MEIIRGRLSTKDFSPQNLRYNSGTDMIEFTPDGGTTWNPDPADDPRHSPKFAKPLKTGSSIQCDSAASMVEWISNFIEYEISVLEAGATVTTVANAALLLFDIIAPWAILIQALIELAGTIFGIGATALETAFTDETYDLLLCCFYCNIEADGTVTIDDLAAVSTQVTTDLNTTAALIVGAILTAQGEMGVQNAGTLYDVAGECDDCGCEWRYRWTFTENDGGWDTCYYGDYGGRCATWVDGIGWRGEYSGYGNAYGLVWFLDVRSAEFDLPSGSAITQCIAHYGNSGISPGGFIAIGVGTSLSDFQANTPLFTSNEWTAEQATTGAAREGAVSAMRAWNDQNWVESQQALEWYEIRGTGDQPDFTGGEWM